MSFCGNACVLAVSVALCYTEINLNVLFSDVRFFVLLFL